jgi:soluble lytic murein transglycosylase
VLRTRITWSLLAVLLVVLIGELAYLEWQRSQPKESIYDPIIVAVARENDVDPFLVRALIWRESRFEPTTYGLAQEHGLMQVRPEVGEEWAKAMKISDFQPDQLFDPVTNIRVGTWYLSHALHHWDETDDPMPFALAEYNAGRSNALKWVDPANPRDPNAFVQRITFPTTRKYVEVILEKRAEYRVTLAHDRWYREFETTSPSSALGP